ncbi:MAG: N-acetylmuramoyl-L-alanine amidase [Lachnospiraceae bacterium]
MAYKIVLDAGHGGWDNGAQYDGRKEKDDVLNLTLAVGSILKSYGFDVFYTRTEDVYDSPIVKARKANAYDADFFVSIHRNSSPYPNQYNGVESLIYEKGGIQERIAENIDAQLERVGFRNIGVSERPNLIVLNSTQMPAVLVEVGFINTDSDNILFDTKFYDIAYAIADGITMSIYPENYK